MSKLLKVFLRLLVLVGVVLFLSTVGAAAVEGNMGRKKHIRPLSKFDLNYASKRRIPNGPDPIHNRRAGNSHQPPGQA